ncbi:MAG: translational GTPase TypA [Actinobacteria bacterium]|nr:MAG: translational GTPase TypA [Actinomycetota bacterium]
MTAPEQKRLRNIALIAHVDHGKTTLVEAMLRQTGVVRDASTDHMDTLDLEREKGITILAKAASIIWHGVTINLVDTPGHSDFGGEVERALAMVDGVLLLVDASEGPLPQTRYVLRKAMARNLPSVVVLNKVDRKDARASEVLDEIYQLYIDLGADDHHIEFPVISAVAREGRSMMGVGMPPEDADLSPLLNTVLQTIPPPSGNPNAPLQALVTNLDASDYLGRLAIGRVFEGRLRLERPTAVIGADGNPVQAKLTSLQRFVGLGRDNAGHVDAGDLFILAGIPTIEIGDTIADPSEPRALERLHVDEPVLTMTFGPSTSPLSGEGKFLTARHISDRLRREALGNVSIRITSTENPDVMEVAGRGELQLAVLIETMRREGYEFQVSRPEVVTKTVDGALHEPQERITVDVPSDHVGTVTQIIAPRRGEVIEIRPGETGRSIVVFEAPARGLLGFRTLLLTMTQGTAVAHVEAAGWIPWAGELPHRKGGGIVADRTGRATGYALDNLQERGTFFIEPGDDVYEGMVVGENARADDMVVNPTKEKQKTNMRTHAADEAIKLEPARELTVETAIEFIAADELVEVTPTTLRIRKRILDRRARERAAV